MRTKIAAGNWKMNLDQNTGKELVQGVVDAFQKLGKANTSVIFAPAYPFLAQAAAQVADIDHVYVAAQNLHQAEKGAFTGEVSASMLTSIGVTHCILGHSERRQYFDEDNALLATKVDQALAHGLIPIFCMGETLEQREAGHTLEVVTQQIEEALFHLSSDQISTLILAYEPVWAIGTGKTATPAQAQEVHAAIRGLFAEKYGAEIAQGISILYGGSVKPGNAEEICQQPDIDGGLVGGASLKVPDFTSIIEKI